MTDYPLTTVIGVALACMGAVSIIGPLVKPLTPYTVECSITMQYQNSKATYVGQGEIE